MTLLMTTMCPERLFFMSGITSLIMRTTPKKLVSNTCFISSMLMLSTGPSKPTPALLTVRKQTCYHPQLCCRPGDELQMLPLGVSLWQPQESCDKTLVDGEGSLGQGPSAQSWEAFSPAGVSVLPGRQLLSPGSYFFFGEKRNPFPDCRPRRTGLMTPALGANGFAMKGRQVHQ